MKAIRCFYGFLLFILLFLLTDCKQRILHHKAKFNIYIDNSFIKENKINQVIDGVLAWEQASTGVVSFNILIAKDVNESTIKNATLNEVGDDYAIFIINAQSKNVPSALKREDLIGLNTTVNGLNVIYIFSDRLVQYNTDSSIVYKALTTHEVGHAIGLSHIDDINSIMFSVITASPLCITKLDMDQFCKLYYCNNHKLNYCQ